MEKQPKQRKVYTPDFKISAAKLVLEQGMTRTRVGKDLGVCQNLVGKWVKELASKQGEAFPGNGRLSPKDQQISDLLKENKRLKMEREILKKATAFFVNHGG